MNSNPMKPAPALLCKLGSIAVHAEEMLGLGAHDFDRIALAELLKDPEVRAWLEEMDKLAMVPKKR